MLDPYHILDLPPDATLAEARRAHQQLRTLYDFGSTATFGLLDDDERQACLERLDQALEAIASTTVPASTPENTTSAPVSEPVARGPAPDPQSAPGAFLAWTRKSTGLSIKELAERTKIRPSQIEAIENHTETRLAPVYLRGFVHNIARDLGIRDPHKIADFYMNTVQDDRSQD